MNNLPTTDLTEYPKYRPLNPIKRQQILQWEKELTLTDKEGRDAIKLPVRHWFCNGLYARELFIPAGTRLTGKIHKTEHLVIISQGLVSVVTEFESLLIQAPHTMITVPGTKRALYVLEDVLWTNIHPTNEKDVSKIEEAIIAKTYEDLEIWRG